jgi:hypothetical protein
LPANAGLDDGIPLGFSRIWIYGFGVAGGVNDDDALALFELGDDVVTVNRRQQQHGDGEEEPEPRQPVTPSAARKVSATA